ncbi:putative NEP-interacting protein [Thalictrum thalictroides]|uniref:Putative NEP-interacting protein n=1 Tax=Thalictrum thalictroides TaxID=46969 RepID=A0A7J6VUD3_THATH|nr:putative NEP-interacting protein [Thalictrum thalictroides]
MINRAVEGRSLSEEDTQLQRKLKLLNKASIKSIQKRDGDIYDCVDIKKQPALDHPNLKNHKIQMRPTFSPKRLVSHEDPSMVNSIRIVKLEDEGCPYGTVPIRRITKEDLIRTESFSNNYPFTVDDATGSHFANISTIGDYAYYGARGYIGVYNPQIFSEYHHTDSLISISNGPPQELNSIDVGWTVNPVLYHDNQTRLFTRWTRDGYQKTGCYNTNCPGFVQIDPSTPLGIALQPISVPLGQQYEIGIEVYQDKVTENWWLVVGNEHTTVGYWPKSIFTSLSFADKIVWGGAGHIGGNVHHYPYIGSGRWPEEGYGKAGYFRQIQVMSLKTKGYGYDDVDGSMIDVFSDYLNCYRASGFVNLTGGGYSFLYGGGGSHCPPMNI